MCTASDTSFSTLEGQIGGMFKSLCPWNNEAHGLSLEGWLCRGFTPYSIQIIFFLYQGGLVGYYWNTVLYIPEWFGHIIFGICQWIGYIIGWVLLEFFILYSSLWLTKIFYFEYDNGFDRIWTAESFLYSLFIITQGEGGLRASMSNEQHWVITGKDSCVI